MKSQNTHFERPPLAEVLLGIQFPQCRKIDSTHLGALRALFADKYPEYEERAAIQPQFELFGNVPNQNQVRFQMGPSIALPSIVSMNDDSSNSVHYQFDRLSTSWQKKTGSETYPHYSSLLDDFENTHKKLEAYYQRISGHGLKCEQAEIQYTNVMEVGQASEIKQFLEFVQFDGIDFEQLALTFSEVQRNANNEAAARLHTDVRSVYSVDGTKSAIKYTLTYRGLPMDRSLEGVKVFLNEGHAKITERFLQTTTDFARSHWGNT